MSRRLPVLSLAVVVVLSVGCDQTGPSTFEPATEINSLRSSAEHMVPFRTSSYSFRVIASAPEPGCNAAGESRVYLSGEGAATHLGAFTIGLNFCGRAGGVVDEGQGTLVSANGDLLRVTFHGTSAFAPPYTLAFTSYPVFVGGSGRFDGAYGQAVVTGTLDVRTGAGDGRWEGTVSSVGSR